MQFKDIDAAFGAVGEFGVFQTGVVTILCLLTIPTGFLDVSTYFIVFNPSWRCVENSTVCPYDEILPKTNDSRCHIPRDQWEYVESKEYSIVTQV